MEIINANLNRMPEVTILGFPALLTPERLSRETVHLNLYQYELQGDLSQPIRSITIMEEVEEYFCGTILTTMPLLVEGVSRLVVDPGDIVLAPDSRRYTPAEFERKYAQQ